MKINVRWLGDTSNPWRAKFSGWFVPDGWAYGATPDEAVRNLLKEAHTLVYSIPRRALRQRVDRLPEPPEPTP